MIGGLLSKTTSRVALLAAAGFFLGGVATPSAKAADLGGDCCADLEERVAELEATTARKGNRRMSLTVSGQISRSIIYWQDNFNSGTAYGADNHNQSTRFVFSGTARINPSLMAGFEFMTEWSGGARTSTISQNDVDGAIGSDGTLNVRTANWWLEEKTLGRLTVGRFQIGGPVGTIDLGGIHTVAHWSPGLEGGGMFVTGQSTYTTGAKLGQVIGPTYGGDRIEGVRYDSPSIGGFVFQAAYGEAEAWAASVRYAGEFAGLRVAAGIGYEAQSTVSPDKNVIPANQQLDNGARNMDNEWSASLALMHVPSGLFAQGHYARSEFFNGGEGKFWMVQAGVTKNWTGMGNTSFYGEYGRANDYIQSGAVNTTAALQSAFLLGSSEVTFYGLGVVQQIDAAAMEVFIGWRRFNTDIVGLGGANAPLNGSSELDLVHGGARIRF